MDRHFALTIRLYDARYHGTDDWPPAPARVFQALVAGVARGRRLPALTMKALLELERFPPVIAAPVSWPGQRIVTFVPNNDADAVGGDPARIGEVRAKKTISPRLFEGDVPFFYAWPLEHCDAAGVLVSAANSLYQLGRGVDMAWAIGEVIDNGELATRLERHRGPVFRPSGGEGSIDLACPVPSSLESLVARHHATLVRLRRGVGKWLFAQQPKARFPLVAYEGRTRMSFDLRQASDPSVPFPWPLERATALIERVRDAAAAALRAALPDQASTIERLLIGRKPDSSGAGPIGNRVRFMPIPSIGHEHADRAIRRVLVELPAGAGLAAGDLRWALSGCQTHDPSTGELDDLLLVPTQGDPMIERYERPSHRWRTVTPIALGGGSARRRRIDPARRIAEAKGAAERLAEEAQARAALGTALRQAGIDAVLRNAQLQREPFEARGRRVELFAPGTRFEKERLWHAQIELDHAVAGPLVIGDGRFLGLGVMAPVHRTVILYALRIESGLTGRPNVVGLARALRRAVMACAQSVLGPRAQLPPFFSGHGPDGRAAREEDRPHLAFAFDAEGTRLLVVSPPRAKDDDIGTLERALDGLTRLRAGSAGMLALRADTVQETDPLLAPSKSWRSTTPYLVNRHAKAESASNAVAGDVRDDCRRRGLPVPDVTVVRARGVRGVGLEADVVLAFRVAVPGPILLGRSRYLGGGLFRGGA